MKLVLLSGGSGKRLWPLSNDSRSKQFLKVLDNQQHDHESMVQRVWGQLQAAGLEHDSVIATGNAQVDMIQSQLGNNVSLIVEPERRDTFPAIALAATYLYSMRETSLNEVVVILPVDPYVENGFFEKVKELEGAISQSDADLALIGVKPTYPSSKYGYIIPEHQVAGHSYVKVSHFKEKPQEDQAKILIEQDALWNCGVFAFKLDYLINLLIEKGLPIQYEELLKQYGRLDKISFDYEVVEKANHIVTLPYDGYWKDLGTWNTLTEEMAANVMGKGMMSSDSSNTHIVNELDIPVTVLGLSNVVVAASADGILVTEKSASPRIKEILGSYDERPMYEERRWGWYKVLDYSRHCPGQEVLTKRICITAGKNSSYQIHYKRSEVWTFTKGEGDIVINDRLIPVKAGDVWHIPVGTKHAVRASSDLEFIEVQSGSELVEEDISRLLMTWDEIKNHCLSKL
ncbi:sugar phosphate nucleotidyltransferase [Paenibacillus aestuarii]|uniref:Sugar phosphate nucleotidyltransferase n=1 Tax=Paenibacillus aestuarii TaxID=516965 RepID=A0ABW0K0J5_9BACL|nr:sugar phosphate nucleotidyltransferase [Paenibacillus aestuarii]